MKNNKDCISNKINKLNKAFELVSSILESEKNATYYKKLDEIGCIIASNLGQMRIIIEKNNN